MMFLAPLILPMAVVLEMIAVGWVILGLSMHYLLRRGAVQLVSGVFSALAWVLVLALVIFSGGIRTAAFSSFLTVIIISGILLGVRAGFVMAGLSALAGLGLIYAEMTNRLPTPLIENTPVFVWVFLTINFGVVIVVLHLALRSVQEALQQSQYAEQALINAQLQAKLGNWEWDIQTDMYRWSDEQFHIFGYLPGAVKPTYSLFAAALHPADSERVLAQISQTAKTGLPFETECRIVRPDGSMSTVVAKAELQRNGQGRSQRVVGTVLDITERKQVEAALRQSEERLQQAVRASQIGIFDHDHLSDTIYWSPEQRRNYGWGTAETVTMAKFLEQVYPEDRARIGQAVQRAHDPAGDGLFDVEHRIIRRDGAIRWLATRSQTFLGEEGGVRRPIRTVGAVLDVTESREVAEALRVKDRAMTSAINAIIIAGADGNVTYVNPSFVRMWGYDDERELLGVSAQTLWTYAVNEPSQVTETMLRAGSWIGEVSARKKDGSRFEAQLSASLTRDESGSVAYLMGSFIDITQRKRAERMLQTLNAAALAMQSALNRDQMFNAVAAELRKVGLHCAIFVTTQDRQGMMAKYWSYTSHTIRAVEELTGLRIHNIVIPTRQIDAFRRVIWEQQTTFVKDVQEPTRQFLPRPLKGLAGSVVEILKIPRSINAPMVVDGQAIGLFSVQSHDLSESDGEAITAFSNQLAAAWRQSMLFEQAQHELAARRRAEQEIRRLNAELEQRVAERTRQLQDALTFQHEIMGASSTGIVVYNEAGQCVLANQASAAMANATLEQVLEQNYHHLDSWRQSGLYDAALTAVNTGHETQRDVHMTSSFGQEVWLNCRCIPFLSRGAPHLLLTFNDMSQRIKAEAEIRELNQQLQVQANNLAAANKELEAFSYSVSHDLRAPLRAIDGYSRILAEDYASSLDDEGIRFCGVIQQQTQRMGQLIDDLLAFSRLGRTEMQTSPIDMTALVHGVLRELTQGAERERIEVRIAELPPALGDSTLIRQVWLNLLANALKFSAKQPQTQIEVGSKAAPGEAIYYVRDNGAGFDMRYVDKLFGVFQRLHNERDFPGTGVGLAIVQRVIHRHGGRVWAEGAVNHGATFYFTLPRQGD